MKKNSIYALCLAAAFAAGGLVSAPLHEMVQHPESVKAAMTSSVPAGYTPIYTIDDLYAVRNNLSGNYILMNDIDMSETRPGGRWDSGNGWKPIGALDEGYFSGTFDGNGYTIRNMYIYGESNESSIGLFGKLSKSYGTSIEHLTLEYNIDVSVNCSGLRYVGAIAGLSNSQSAISECYATGNMVITGFCSTGSGYHTYCGGLVGYWNGSVQNCFDTSNITLRFRDNQIDYSTIALGGVSGFAYQMTNCYQAGSITVENNGGYYAPKIGAVTGVNDPSFQNGLANCYYPQNASGYSATPDKADSFYSNVGAMDPARMRSQSSYYGFDFNSVWMIDPNAAYPYPTLRNLPAVNAVVEQPADNPWSDTTTSQTETTTTQTETTTSTSTTTTTTTSTTTTSTTTTSATATSTTSTSAATTQTESTASSTSTTWTETTTVPEPPANSSLKGDINGDGKVNASDASIILIYAANIGSGNLISIDDLY